MSENTMSNVHLVTIVVANLGGHEKYIHSEDIAIHADRLAPGKFTWRKYPEYIDLQVVNQALQDARRERNGGLVLGKSLTGWMLSPAGIKWISSLDVEGQEITDQLAGYRRGSLQMSQEIESNRLRNTEAFKSYEEDKGVEITLNDFYKFARINEYFPSKTRQRRFAFIDGVVIDNVELQDFWTVLKDKFPEEFR